MQGLSGNPPSIFKLCPNHAKPMKSYCEVDEVSICEDCIIDKHKGHLYSPLLQVIESKKFYFQKVIDNCKEEVNDLQQAIEKIEKLRMYMRNSTEEKIKNLDYFFDNQKEEIRQRVRESHNARDNILHPQKDILESLLNQFKSISVFAQNMLQYSTAQDVIDLEQLVIKKSEKLKEKRSRVVPQVEEQKLKFLKEDKPLEPLFHSVSGIDIKKCKIIGPKNTRVTVGEEVIFYVTLYPLYDHHMLNLDSLTVQVHYFNNSDDVTTEKVTIKKDTKCNQFEDEEFEITYIASKSGDHMVSILIEGQHIPRSPFQ